MARTASDYQEQLAALLPPGQAFPREAGGSLADLLAGMAEEWARVDARAEQLIIDANPLASAELLPDWERVTALPDNCAGVLADTLQGRRAALLTKLASTGVQSAAYFVEVAAALGYAVTIEEFRPFRAGLSVAGDALTNGDWVFTWRVNAPAVTVTPFRAGRSGAGEALAAWGNDTLECKINQLKPAHTVAQFAYFTPLAAPASLSVEYVA